MDNYDIEDLAADSDRSIEKYKEDVREFVGTVYQKHDVDDVDIGKPPDEYEGESPSLAAWKGILESEAPSALGKVDEIKKVSLANLDIDFSPLIKALDGYQSEVSQALQQKIQNFDPPDSYDPKQVSVDPFAKQAGTQALQQFIDELEDLEDEPIQSYVDRLRRGLDAYESDNHMLASFVFISVQDGLMMTLCIRHDDMERGDDGYFTPQQRKTALKSSYEEIDREFRDLESGDVIPHLDTFLEHRNHIMHGNITSFFDKNIATISLLFFTFTFHTVLESSEK